MNETPCQNTDRQIWRRSSAPFSPSIHVTAHGSIGINVDGHVIVSTVEDWHRAGELLLCCNETVPPRQHRRALRMLRGETLRRAEGFTLFPTYEHRFNGFAPPTRIRRWLWWEKNLPS
jgi:hypothetical protein